MKSPIDIEALLVWAYRDQAIDRLIAQQKAPTPEATGSAWDGFDHLERYGTFIQSSAIDLCTPGSMAYDDADAVHGRVLALDDAFVQTDGDTIAVWDRALIAEQGSTLLEWKRGAVSLRTPDGQTHPLERVVISTILILHARVAGRPECYAEIARRRGQPRRDSEAAPGVTFADLTYHRAVYAVWHAALGILAAELGDSLAQWKVTGPAAHESPWLLRVLPAKQPNLREKSFRDKPLKSRKKSAA